MSLFARDSDLNDKAVRREDCSEAVPFIQLKHQTTLPRHFKWVLESVYWRINRTDVGAKVKGKINSSSVVTGCRRLLCDEDIAILISRKWIASSRQGDCLCPDGGLCSEQQLKRLETIQLRS